MKLDKNRQFEYNLNKIPYKHPRLDYYELTYTAVDNSRIYTEVMVPKGETRGIFVEIPDYKVFPKDYLNLGRYAILDYAVASLHVRGQAGQSENRQAASIYFPFLNNQNEELYYNFVYQDVIDLIAVLKKEFPELEINVLAIGQGASAGLVAAAVTKDIANLFISNAQNIDFSIIFKENADVGVYEAIRDYNRNYPEKEDYMMSRLNEIDILNYAKEVEAKVYYGYSHLNVRTPEKCQDKLLALLTNKEIIHYRKFEHEVLQEHFFDEFVLRKLGEYR